MARPFHVVLHEPEIPNNTGNIGRTCVATGAMLHLIKPMSFNTDEKALRRAGLDYWPRLNPTEHDSFDAYRASTAVPSEKMWFFTTKAACPMWEAPIHPGDHLIFGKETAGLPAEIIQSFPHRLVTLPMVPGERSLNLATAVCAALYEAARQCVKRNQYCVDEDGRLRTDRGISPATR